MNTDLKPWLLLVIVVWLTSSCREKTAGLVKGMQDVELKRGAVISCGPAEGQFGSVSFPVSCGATVQDDFNLAIKLLHSFEYDEAEKVFARIIDKNPECAMAWWGVAMSNFHPLWTPPSEAELKKGEKAVRLAQSLAQNKKEKEYISALAAFYTDWQRENHRTRCTRFEEAMAKLHDRNPDDQEAAVFYALALNAAVDPADKTFARQRKAGDLLHALYAGSPNHPGIVHYIIHNYDAPELAEKALPAARRYASVAPSSAHALHMPSHIFTRLGLWDECIRSNLASVNSAQCYAEAAGIRGHWDEELHGLDYLMYAYLQKGENEQAKKQLSYLQSIREVHPANFKVAYAFAAIPCRYILENRLWKEAAVLQAHHPEFDWNSFPWQKAMVHFTRALGAAHTGKMDTARAALQALQGIHRQLVAQKDAYKATQVLIQAKAAEAWILYKEGDDAGALQLMQQAASLEDGTEKHPVTPGEVLPARELLGDLLLQMNKPAEALREYELALKKHPNRFNGLYSAGVAAERSGDTKKAVACFQQLLSFIDPVTCTRPEVKKIRQFLQEQ